MIFSIADLIIVKPMLKAGTAGLVAVLAAGTLSARETVPLEVVLKRAAAYVATYHQALRGVVAEESYSQSMVSSRGGGPTGRARLTRDSRRLKSDLLFVKLANEERWMQFRDVFEVDRVPVRDRDQRLYKLFVDAKPDAEQQAEAIQRESARYNLGPIMRTINIPMMALFIFDHNIHGGVQYKLGDAGNTKRFADLGATESVALIQFEETTKDTLIKGEKGREVPAHGRAWIDAADGRILQTELIAQDIEIRAQINVTYRRQEGITVLVPAEMRETYTVRRNDTRIDGRAQYDKFRQFTVTTTEKPKP
jgi:hypothetical protein